ncbi:hypothetical protein FRC04_009412 [Tulasnella sp. 424]|nr:hypothetical protein FRC04_009412 [Tulasnella sp. 424]KAG8971864.1 hypothetical protein FRC05_010531 [Tulasnella sp. 425]
MALLHCDLDDIKFLCTIFDDVNDVLGDAGTRSIEMKGLGTVRSILNEVLAGHRCQSRDDTSVGESQNPSDLECGEDSAEDDHDESWTEEWEFGKLCKWILDQAQAYCLEGDEECGHIVEKLKSRITDLETENDPFGQARREEAPRSEETESAHDSCPISLLPVELLQHIFRLITPPRHRVRTPLELSHVNSHFRTIALSTPSLWTVLDDSLAIPLLELYAARSGNEPLDMTVRPDYLFSKYKRSVPDWFRFLFTESARFERVTVVGYSPHRISTWGRWINGTLGIKEITFPSLAKLVISLGTSIHNRVVCPRWALSPFLRELWIEGCWCSGWIALEDPFHPTLRYLRLSRVSDVPLMMLLQAVGGVLGLVGLALEHFSLSSQETAPPLSNRVTLAFLEKLEFERLRAADMSTISRYLSTPNLSSLSITCPQLSSGTTDFLTPFTLAHPQISSLRILDCRLTPNEWVMALRNLDNLANLHVRASGLADRDFSTLAEGIVVPRLSHITFENELGLTTAFIERVVRAHPNVESVVLRGWAASNVSQGAVEAIFKLARHVILDVFDGAQQENESGSEDSYASSSDESYWEGSDFEEDDGWLSGDREVVAYGS